MLEFLEDHGERDKRGDGREDVKAANEASPAWARLGSLSPMSRCWASSLAWSSA